MSTSQSYDEKEIFEWYRQFSFDGVDIRFLQVANAFKKVSPDEIELFDTQSRIAMPAIYKRFLLEVGEGYISQNRSGHITKDCKNYFMGPDSILEILSKNGGEWNEYPEFIGDDELPFFDLGDLYVYTFCPGNGQNTTVWAPNKFYKITDSFIEFLALLRENVEFYRSIGQPLNG
jgi:hypothetical protein